MSSSRYYRLPKLENVLESGPKFFFMQRDIKQLLIIFTKEDGSMGYGQLLVLATFLKAYKNIKLVIAGDEETLISAEEIIEHHPCFPKIILNKFFGRMVFEPDFEGNIELAVQFLFGFMKSEKSEIEEVAKSEPETYIVVTLPAIAKSLCDRWSAEIVSTLEHAGVIAFAAEYYPDS